VSELPKFVELNDCAGDDTVSRLKVYIEVLYGVYLKTVAFGKLTFRDLSVKCQFRPETNGKHYAFWHMMQEGKIEDDRTIDLERCRRMRWISWVIKNADNDSKIRVFPQAARSTTRGAEQPWALWLYEHDYVVILWERNGYYLLKTAFTVKPHKHNELERDWEKHSKKD
jgi:hypothetical protein